jgi:hypothetical protein
LMRLLVGSVTRLKIFSKVDLPAPLRPMMPTRSPCLISKETSFKAQNSSLEGEWASAVSAVRLSSPSKPQPNGSGEWGVGQGL